MLPHGEDLPFRTVEIGDPRDSGYKLGWGIPIWAVHYRKTLGHDNAMHLKIAGERAHLHREHVNPDDNLVEHLKRDMKLKHWVAVSLSVLGVGAIVAFLANLKR